MELRFSGLLKASAFDLAHCVLDGVSLAEFMFLGRVWLETGWLGGASWLSAMGSQLDGLSGNCLTERGVLAPPSAEVRIPRLSYNGSGVMSDTLGGSELQLCCLGRLGMVTYPCLGILGGGPTKGECDRE